MTTHFEILSLIESVDPTDTVKLDEYHNDVQGKMDELDCIVHAWIHRFELDSFRPERRSADHMAYCRMAKPGEREDGFPYIREYAPQYTRSRDFLKTIRPKNVSYSMIQFGAFSDKMCWKCRIESPASIFTTCGLPTEELAELYAIIQAIGYERHIK